MNKSQNASSDWRVARSRTPEQGICCGPQHKPKKCATVKNSRLGRSQESIHRRIKRNNTRGVDLRHTSRGSCFANPELLRRILSIHAGVVNVKSRAIWRELLCQIPPEFSYLIVTVPPAVAISALILSASSFDTPVLTVFGAPSTRSLASFRPRPVIVRITLMTSSFFSP